MKKLILIVFLLFSYSAQTSERNFSCFMPDEFKNFVTKYMGLKLKEVFKFKYSLATEKDKKTLANFFNNKVTRSAESRHNSIPLLIKPSALIYGQNIIEGEVVEIVNLFIDKDNCIIASLIMSPKQLRDILKGK